MSVLKFDRRDFGSYSDTQIRYMQIGWNKCSAAQKNFHDRIATVRSLLAQHSLKSEPLSPNDCAILALKLEMTSADVPQ